MLSEKKHAAKTVAAVMVIGLLLSYGFGTSSDTAGKADPPSEKILARVGNKIITSSEYKDELSALPYEYREAADLYKEQFLQSLINKYLLLREAKRKNLSENEDVKNMIRKAEEEIMVQELIKSEIYDRAKVSESDIGEHYNKNKRKYFEPPKTSASHILVDSEVIAIKILDDLARNVEFEKLAKEYSLDIPTKDAGGNIGYFEAGTLLPKFEQACEDMEIGETSGVVKTELGYHIIKMIDKKEARPRTLNEVKENITNELLLNRQAALYESLLLDLRKDQEVSINRELLETIDLEEGSSSP